MVLEIIFAHGADPSPLAWDEALANLVKFSVTFLLIGIMSYPILVPLFRPGSVEEPLDSDSDSPETTSPSGNPESVGWVAAAILLVLAMGWWLTRASLVEVTTPELSAREEHGHAQTEGGQVAMWGDFHAEVVRVESGELRIFLRDSYNRDIAARFFEAQVQGLTKTTNPTPTPDPQEPSNTDPSESKYLDTESSLNDTFRFALLPDTVKTYKIKISTPGWSTTLKFEFDGSQGRRSLPIWCAKP